MIEKASKPRWGYTHGLVVKSHASKNGSIQETALTTIMPKSMRTV